MGLQPRLDSKRIRRYVWAMEIEPGVTVVQLGRPATMADLGRGDTFPQVRKDRKHAFKVLRAPLARPGERAQLEVLAHRQVREYLATLRHLDQTGLDD